MSPTPLMNPPRPLRPAPPGRPSSKTTERELRRRLAQTRDALHASRRDNEVLRQTVRRLEAEIWRQAIQPGSRLTAAERKRRMTQALNDPCSRNP